MKTHYEQNGSRNNVKSVNSITKQYLKHRIMFRCTERGNDVDSVTRQKKALYWNRIDPVFSTNQQTAITVKSVGLAPALTFNCSRSASVSPPFVRETIKDVSTETQAQVSRAMAGAGGHSGCTCERLQDQFQQKVQTDDDDCTDSAQRMQGKGATDCVAIYQPKGYRGVIGEMKDLANIRMLTEVEGKVSLKGDKISSFSSSFSPL